MLKVLDRAPSELAYSEADPWIPLKLFWRVRRTGIALNLYVTGSGGGFIEMGVDSHSGVLYDLVVIELPPGVDRRLQVGPVVEPAASPVLDRELWPWKVTPDYTELERPDIDVEGELSVSQSEEGIVLWFSELSVHKYLACGEVKVGISHESDLVCVAAPTPPIIEPELMD